jgi:HD superfamily phosphodiesterase
MGAVCPVASYVLMSCCGWQDSELFVRRGEEFTLDVSLSMVASRADWVTDSNFSNSSLLQTNEGKTHYQSVLQVLQQAFNHSFTIINTESGDLSSVATDELSCDFSSRLGMLAEVARFNKPEIVEDVSPLLMIAIPLKPVGISESDVAIGIFLYQAVETDEDISSAASALGLDSGRALCWARHQEIWPPEGLMRFIRFTMQNLIQRGQLDHLRHEIHEAVVHAQDAYIELGMLHRLTNHLSLSNQGMELWQNALMWLTDAMPAQCLAIVPNATEVPGSQLSISETELQTLTHGESPLDTHELEQLVHSLGSKLLKQSIVWNRPETAHPTWQYPTVRELICIPIQAGSRLLGWMLALNHKGDVEHGYCEFGSVEIRLLSSVCTILGIHWSNASLYQQQGELLASSVQSLTSAIDAKDGYTCGHSDRVAQVSVLLAKALGCSKQELHTINLAGLLHDIGKIGINDQVLNKSGKLTTEEYDHIKRHPQLGYDILKEVRQLDHILPIVLHHHEVWDGKGYPHGLQGEEIPLLARIVAVADAYDSMSSDRSYRRRLSMGDIKKIFQDGAGNQWDPDVVEAFFSVWEEIRDISQSRQQNRSLDVEEWVI